ncbi:MAG: hypothetical protein IIC73_07595, partial [Armatimonadetes bacterium]|nr:hypothetical protein [Armatimonadota bacterium]
MAGKLTKGQRTLVGMAVLFIVSGGLIGVSAIKQERDFQRKVEQARADGFPISASDFARRLEGRQGQNAAPFYGGIKDKQGRLAFTDLPRGTRMAKSYSASFTEQEWDELETHLSEFKPILDDVERGSRMDYCFFPKDWSLGDSVLFPEYAAMKKAAEHLAARFRLRLKRGDVDGAIEDLETLSRFSAHLRKPQTLIGLLVSIAVDTIIMRSIEAELPSAETDPKMRAAFGEAVESMPESWDLADLFAGEAFFNYWLIDNVFAEGRMSELMGTPFLGPIPQDIATKLSDLVMSSPFALRQMKTAVIAVWTPLTSEY